MEYKSFFLVKANFSLFRMIFCECIKLSIDSIPRAASYPVSLAANENKNIGSRSRQPKVENNRTLREKLLIAPLVKRSTFARRRTPTREPVMEIKSGSNLICHVTGEDRWPTRAFSLWNPAGGKSKSATSVPYKRNRRGYRCEHFLGNCENAVNVYADYSDYTGICIFIGNLLVGWFDYRFSLNLDQMFRLATLNFCSFQL